MNFKNILVSISALVFINIGAQDLTVNGDLITTNGKISDNPWGSSYAAFSHKNRDSQGNYAIMQASWGETYINASSGWPIWFRINESTKMVIKSDGKVGIGTTNPTSLLTVNGKINCEEIEVLTLASNNIKTNSINLKFDNAADYVFKNDYRLKPLSEVEAFIKENKHLPGIPSANHFKENGMNVSEMTNILLEKVEELTLYTIQLQKELETLKANQKK